jgi:gamma-glutamylputrescine oxidase
VVDAIAITSWTTTLAAHSRHCAGCLWATFAAGNILGDADEDHWKYYPTFPNRRHLPLPSGLARIMGKPALFPLASSWAKLYRVDTHRKPVAMKDEF